MTIPDNLQSIIRAVLVAGGGWLVNSGFVSAEQWQAVVGAVMALGAVAWAIYSNRQAHAAKVVSAVVGTPVVTPLVGKPTVSNAVPTPTAAVDMAKAAKAV
jgi:uncharacterized membrane protein YjjB (DUF3815 family)